MEQINVAGFLKNAPAGIKLYSPVYGEVTFDSISADYIRCVHNNAYVYFDKYGKIDSDGEVMLFPKKNRNWNSWAILIKDGDIVRAYTEDGVKILKARINSIEERLYRDSLFFDSNGKECKIKEIICWATKEEVESFRDNQAIRPFFFDCKFKACCPKQEDNCTKQDNHFEPFDKVLVRNEDEYPWDIELFAYIIPGRKYRYQGIRSCWKHCIPYNDNTKHLVGTTEPYLG